MQAVQSTSPAHDAGLREGDLITHVNGEPTEGLLHVQVVSLILSGGSKVTIRAVPIDTTSIKMGGRKKPPNGGKMARRSTKKKTQKKDDKKRKTSLLRRLSSKRAEQLGSPLTPSKSLVCLNRSLSSGDSMPGSPTRAKSPKSPPTGRVWSPASDSANSSQSSSPSSSTPNSPASSSSSHYSRPSSLHGLKHKLQQQTIKSPHRRKSVHNIPLSPLARTPSPSAMATSPTRSPSPLTMVQGQNLPVTHPHGISNMTQKYNPGQSTSPSPIQTVLAPAARRSLNRPKSCEPGSPLLRRALSPDRLHPSSAEKQQTLQRKTSWQEKRQTSDSS